jgi:AcrR family transcriptional regulator
MTRKERTRELLVRAGRGLFAQRSVESVSIDELVLAAGVAKGSFYNHFDGREVLAHCVADEIRNELNARARLVNGNLDDAAARVACGLAVYFRYAIDEPDGAAALARIHGPDSSADSPSNAPVVEDLQIGIASGRFRIPTLDAGLMLIVAMGMAGLLRIVSEPSQGFAVSITQQLSMLVLRGLGVAADEAEQIAAQAADAVVRNPQPPAAGT